MITIFSIPGRGQASCLFLLSDLEPFSLIDLERFFIIINSRIELEQNNYERFDMCLSQNLEIMRTTYSSEDMILININLWTSEDSEYSGPKWVKLEKHSKMSNVFFKKSTKIKNFLTDI